MQYIKRENDVHYATKPNGYVNTSAFKNTFKSPGAEINVLSQ